jgi:Na+-translocating ferredoxin:NAD+ oxidoreductase RnfC subunit
VVLAIEKRPIPHPSGIDGVCIVIDSDGKDKWIEIEKCDHCHLLSHKVFVHHQLFVAKTTLLALVGQLA